MDTRDESDKRSEPVHLKAPSRGRSLLLAVAALALASPAYLYAALTKPAVIVRINDSLGSEFVVVKVGEAVEWRNDSTEPRTIEVQDGAEQRSAVLEPGESYEHRFQHTGVHRFGAADDGGALVRAAGVISVEP